MLNQLKRDRDYQPSDACCCSDKVGPDDIPRRRLVQREIHLCQELDFALYSRYTPDCHALAAKFGKLKGVVEAALDNNDMIADHKAADGIVEALYDHEGDIASFMREVTAGGVRIGFLAGQREGFRLACAILTKVFTTPAVDPLANLPFANKLEALAVLVGAQLDDSLADSLIERLVTGTTAAPVEGGAQA